MTRLRHCLPLVLAGVLLAGQVWAAAHDRSHALGAEALDGCATCLYAGHADTGIAAEAPAPPHLLVTTAPTQASRCSSAQVTRRHHPIRAPPALSN